MQIARLSQCFNRQKVVKIGRKRTGLNVTTSITRGYETFA
ncbi:hypothetical protein HMPREF9019_2114 [Hoylesella timonensis CRIS 5C-B1]|uniref:Uncharacterized protein n=1 Tax=Hoylesella timonensis CRIS 5C-B1 TaxID=679189 RepID=D1VZT8_9BACT|nr:hypothetical protein HMPREF9019_2114 [Hoylesella timonensis CRIS 5C-B1]